MKIWTPYGDCDHIDLNHLKEYQVGKVDQTSLFMFTDYIIDNGDDGYLLFGFEVHHDKNNEFIFWVEEGFEDGSSDTYRVDINRDDATYIKGLYLEYISRK